MEHDLNRLTWYQREMAINAKVWELTKGWPPQANVAKVLELVGFAFDHGWDIVKRGADSARGKQ